MIKYERCERTGNVCAVPLSRTEVLAARAAEILEELAKVPPKVRYQQLIDSGLIDSEGRLRAKYGGDVP